MKIEKVQILRIDKVNYYDKKFVKIVYVILWW